MPIPRNAETALRADATRYPVVTVTGPRQSGKTTLCREIFADRPYVSLETPDNRDWAHTDPRGFLRTHRAGAVFDEIQNAPDLLSWLQGEVDADPTPGRFILTGSQQLGLQSGIAQSLAGRTAVLHLLPPSREELIRFPTHPQTLWDTVFMGAYPRIHDRGLPPTVWLADYVATYVQRDVRDVSRINDLSTFTTFLRLCAGRTGQELNLSALGADTGVSQQTAKAWLSILEAAFLVHRLPPWHANLRKRWVKTPKLHFVDTGLACYLLGITSADQLQHHPLRGALFESWVVGEAWKAHAHARQTPRLYHWREVRGSEVDLLIEGLPRLVEMKSGETVSTDAVRGLVDALAELGSGTARLVYGGTERTERLGVEVRGWSTLIDADWLGP